MSEITIRDARHDDAVAYVTLQKALFGETNFMLFAPGEYLVTPEDASAQLEKIANSGSGRRLLAIDQGDLAGFLGVSGSPIPRIRHSALLVAVQRAVAERGCKLLVADIYPPAAPFYHRLNWREPRASLLCRDIVDNAA